jgi:uncharacterized protein YbjT (DUF2867 family)
VLRLNTFDKNQETVLVVGATGRHGGSGARVVERMLAAGRRVRALVRSDDERAQRLRESGVQTLVGDLHDRRTLPAAFDGVDSVYIAYPVAPGLTVALVNVASVIEEQGSAPHVVVLSMGAADHDSPSGLARAHAVSDELLVRLGINVSAVRGSAFFYENALVMHSGSINQMGVFANNFGDSRPAWISGGDIGDYCAAVLLEPQKYAGSPIIYPPGYERLSQQEMADIVSEEIGRPVSYQYVSKDEWSSQIGGLVPDATVEHLTSMLEMCANGTTILRKDADPAALEAARGGRPAQSFRDFVHQHRAAFGAVSAGV